MDQPCVAREIGKLAVFGLAPMYPASNWSSCSGPSWNTRASDLISVDASTGKTCHQFDQPAIARELDGAAAMGGDQGIDQLLPERAKPRHRAFLVRAREPAIASHIAG